MDSEDSEYSKLYAYIYGTFVPFEGKTWIKQNKKPVLVILCMMAI